jgi:hypothetical protein
MTVKSRRLKRTRSAVSFLTGTGDKMTDYEFYQHQKNFCEIMGAQKNIDENLRTFYAHAARGFEIKLENMSMSEAANG